jgi:hypothetical protein
LDLSRDRASFSSSFCFGVYTFWQSLSAFLHVSTTPESFLSNELGVAIVVRDLEGRADLRFLSTSRRDAHQRFKKILCLVTRKFLDVFAERPRLVVDEGRLDFGEIRENGVGK